MAIETVFTKQLGAAVANGICTSQSGSAGVPLTLNGSLTNVLSTTTTAAVAPGGTFIPLTAVTGLVVGQLVTDTTTPTAIATNTKITAVGTSGVSVWPPVGGTAGIGSGDTMVFPGTATLDTALATNSAIGRRVVLAYTGTDTSFVIVGTNSTGNVITDTAVGSSGAATSNLDFVTVTSITPVGGGLTLLTAGTNAVGSSPWWVANWRGYAPENINALVELVSGSATYSVEYTEDDPNNLQGSVTFPLPSTNSTPAALIGATATKDGLFAFPLIALRLTITTGTGELRARFVQAGAG